METALFSTPEVRKPETFRRKMMRFSFFDVQGKIWAVILVVLAMFFVLLASVYNWAIPLQGNSIYMSEHHAKKSKDVYGIIFDAGSTGSRIHIFHFLDHGPAGRLTPIGTTGKQMTLVKDTFREIKPGLSAYAHDTNKAAMSLVGMLDEAKKVVPKDLQHSCPIALKATAGLRLLGLETAENILNKVRELFRTYPFKMVDNGIEIMSGMDEGVFSWITVNYMLDLLTDNKKTVAALDLGGGSTQLTFVPHKADTLKKAPKDFSKSISLVGTEYHLYTHSYLGLGLMSARFEMMEKYPGDPKKLMTSCFPPKVTEQLKKGGITYTISARQEKNGFDPCYISAQGLIKKNVDLVDELKDHHIMLFSYFYDRGVDYGMIKSAGGNVTVENFRKAAEDVCQKPKNGHPFLCMDLTYIFSLLQDGYLLPEKTVVQLTKKVKGIEISWALGAVFDLLAKTTTKS